MDVSFSTFVIAIIMEMNISAFSGRLSEWPTIIHGICGRGIVLQKGIFLRKCTQKGIFLRKMYTKSYVLKKMYTKSDFLKENVQNTDETTLYVKLSNKKGCPKVSL